MANLPMNISQLCNNNSVRQRFNEVLGAQAGTFIGALVSLTNGNEKLRECNPQTVLSAAMTAATLKLPINPNLGFAYLVPYKNKGKLECTFQLGWHGTVQLAMRSGQYQRINVAEVHEGEIEKIDFITGDIVRGSRKSDKIIGYVAYYRLINGFEKTLFMTIDQIKAHAQKYSQTYRKGFGVWVDNFDAMAKKTVLKLLISRFGIMSVDMQSSDMAMAMAADQAVIRDSRTGEYDYVDNQPDDEAAETVEAPEKLQEAAEAALDAGHEEVPTPEDEAAQKAAQDAEDDAILMAGLDESMKKH